MSLKINGLDDLQKQLKKMENAAKELDGTHDVELETLFNSTFMRKYTNHSTFTAFLETGSFNVETQDDFDAIPDEDLDVYVRNSTRFTSWEDMLENATANYVTNKLGL